MLASLIHGCPVIVDVATTEQRVVSVRVGDEDVQSTGTAAKRIVDRPPGQPTSDDDDDPFTIVHRIGADPPARQIHEEWFQEQYRADAEVAARTVFPVCTLRETGCGYDILT